MRQASKSDRSLHQLHIGDVRTFGFVLRTVLERFSSRRRAAAALGIDPSRFMRLFDGAARGTQKRIATATFERICDALRTIELGIDETQQVELREMFRGTVLPPAARGIQERYNEWLREELQRLEPVVGPVLRQLLRLSECKQEIQQFQRRLIRPSDQPPRKKRLLLAVYRAVEPLADARRTLGMERSWRELHEEGDLLKFLRAGLRREEILLKRALDHDRLATLLEPGDYEWWVPLPDDVPPLAPEAVAEAFTDIAKTEKGVNARNAPR